MIDHSREILGRLLRLLVLVGRPGGVVDGSARRWARALPPHRLRMSVAVRPAVNRDCSRPVYAIRERRAQLQTQRLRRRALWLAVYGIDIGPRVIHGVRVAG